MKRITLGFLVVAIFLGYYFFHPSPAGAVPSDTVHITSTTTYTCATRDRVYILDNDMSASGTAITITASNIVLDLNGKTVTFGTDSTTSGARGIYLSGGPDTVVIKHGRIIHDKNGSGAKIIYGYGGTRNLEIANIFGRIKGKDSDGILLLEDGDIYIHDNTLECAMTSITDRHTGKDVIGIQRPFYLKKVKVENNVMYGNAQFGIRIIGRHIYPVDSLIIRGNQSWVNGITTNPYQIMLTGFSKSKNGTYIEISKNRITSPGSVSNRGMILDGIDGTFDGIDGAKIFGNYFDVKEHGNLEYGEAGWTHGIRMRDQGDGQKKMFNNEFYNDTIIATGYYVTSDTLGDGYGIRLSLSCPLSDAERNTFHNNVIKAVSTNASKEAYCVDFEYVLPGNNTVFYDNEFITNSRFISCGWNGGREVLFRNNTFDSTTTSAPTVPFRFWRFANNGSSINNILLDNSFGSGVNPLTCSQQDGGARSFWVRWYLDVNVRDSTGLSVSNAKVNIKDKNNTDAFTGFSDSAGRVRADLTEYYCDASNSSTIKTYYSPYRVTISKGGDTSRVDVTMDASKEIGVQINGENNCPSVPVLSLPVNGDTILGLRPTLVLNNSTDSDLDNLTYGFQVYSDSQLVNLVANATNVAQGENITSWQVTSDLSNESWYWWRARSFDGVCYSNWSVKRKFYVEVMANNCPSIPTLNLPADGDTVLGTRPMLSLNNSVDTDGDILVYDFQVCSDSQMTSLVVSGTDVLQGEGITYWQTTSDLLEESWYWWRARSYDGVCHSDWSGERKFYAERWVAEVEDSQPTLKSPVDGATLRNSQPTLEVYNITGFESLLYYFQLDSNSQFTNPAQSGGVAEGSAITSWMVSNALSKGSYCWRVRAFDGSEYSLWSEAGRFTVAPEVYVYPNPFKPSSGDENITFTNIPLGSNIKITTLDGKLIKKFTNTQDNQIIWDGKNQEGKNLASGVYLYFVDFPGGSTSGKIVIVR